MKAYIARAAHQGDVIDIYESKKEGFRNKQPYDKTKGLEFVVEEAGYRGVDKGAARWHVSARQLNNDGTYDPTGVVVSFFQDPDFYGWIPEVKVVGKMRKTYERIEEVQP
jgi:hypothetical protein